MNKQRDKALYETFKQVWKTHPELSYDEVIEQVLVSPQPRLWISFYGVYRMLLKILYGSRKGPKGKSRNCLEAEVRRKYATLIKHRVFSKASAYFIAAFIIAEPSRGFYISPAYAKRIIWRVRKDRRKAQKEQYHG